MPAVDRTTSGGPLEEQGIEPLTFWFVDDLLCLSCSHCLRHRVLTRTTKTSRILFYESGLKSSSSSRRSCSHQSLCCWVELVFMSQRSCSFYEVHIFKVILFSLIFVHQTEGLIIYQSLRFLAYMIEFYCFVFPWRRWF